MEVEVKIKWYVRKCWYTSGTSTGHLIWIWALSTVGEEGFSFLVQMLDIVPLKKMQLICSKSAQQPESSWNIYLLGHSSSYQRKLGGRQRYVLKNLADSMKTIWLHICHVPKTSLHQSDCNREV